MCGFVGIAGRAASGDGHVARLAEHRRSPAFDDGLRSIRHRGPHSSGMIDVGALLLGHVRLRVIDVSSAARQPMCTADGRYVLVYNGEVYNFRALRALLRDRGHDFRSESDSEVVLRAWAEWGEAALDRLEGMYAFALWDDERQSLHLVRDRLGIKPLYWHDDGDGTVTFASEVRALLATGLVPRALDCAALRAFLEQQTVPSPRSLVAGVRLLSPGCHLRLNLRDGRATVGGIRSYWDVAERSLQRSPDLAGLDRDAALRGLRERLAAAVERRLVADVPLGAFLSGGVDSTAIVGLMSRVSSEPVRTFTVSFGEPGYDDDHYARIAAADLGTDHHEVRLTTDDLIQRVPAAVAAQDHPSGDGINTWVVAGAAKRAGLTVALSGVGGDELFGGYPSFGRLRLLGRAQPFLEAMRGSMASGAARLARFLRRGVTGDKVAALFGTSGAVPQAYPILRSVFGEVQIRGLLAQAPSDHHSVGDASIPSYSDDLHRRLTRNPRLSLLQQVSVAELTCYMHDVLLRDTDQMSMAHSLEVRVPFLDTELVEYALALPDFARAPTKPPKRFLIEACEDLLPAPVRERPKSGFTMPFDSWMRGPLQSFCEDGVERTAASDAFDAGVVSGAWRGFLNRDPGLPWSRLWLLVALGHWLKREDVIVRA